jgi:hypothetical protein
VLIFAKTPKGRSEIHSVLKNITQQSLAPHHQTHLYRSLRGDFEQIKESEINLDDYLKDEKNG